MADLSRDSLRRVVSLGSPPEAGTRKRALKDCFAKRMTPSAFQDPPRPLSASQTVRARPPEIGTHLSLCPAKKATLRLSGDQKGNDASSVPSSSWGVS